MTSEIVSNGSMTAMKELRKQDAIEVLNRMIAHVNALPDDVKTVALSAVMVTPDGEGNNDCVVERIGSFEVIGAEMEASFGSIASAIIQADISERAKRDGMRYLAASVIEAIESVLAEHEDLLGDRGD